ncbi:hypothetical protein J7L01_01305, partial [bacterium]|nr:hypothetical protein [bacterium]
MDKRRKKRLIVFASAIILLVLLCLSISFFSPAQRVVVRSVFRILGVDARIDFSRLRIAPRRISIDGLRFSMRKSGTSVEFDSLRVEGIGLSEHRVKGLALFGPKIVIAASRKGEAGGSNKKSKKNKKGIPKFRIDSLFVDRASFDAGGFSARDFSYIGSIESRRGAISFAADSIGAFLPGRGRLTRAVGTIAYDGDIALDLSLALMRSKLDLKGSISNFDPIEWQFSGGGDTVDLVEVDSLLGLDALVGKGRVAIDLGGRGDSVSGKVSLDGEIFDIPAGNAQADLLVANQRLLLSNLRGEAWGAFVDDGEVRLDFSDKGNGVGIGIDATVRGLDLNSFVKNGGLPSSLSGSASIEGRIENEEAMLSIKGDLGAGAIFGIPFDEASGSLYVSPDSVRFYPGFDVAFGRDFLTLEGTIVFDGEIFIEFGLWAPDVARIASLLGIENVVGGRLRIENGEVLGSVDHPILSLDLSSDSLVTSFFHHDRLTGDATLYDIATSPHGDVYIMSEGSVAGLGYDSLLVNVEVHGNRYYVKPLRIWGDTLSAKGIAEILAGKDSIGIRTEGLELVLLGKPVVLESTFTVSIVGDRIEASPLFASALGGRIAVDKIRSDLDNVSFKAYLHGLKYEELGDLLGSKDIYGSIDGSFFYSTSGDVKGGTGDYSLNIDDLTTGGLEWDEVKAEGSLHGGVLEVEPFVMSRKTERYTVTGQADLSDADMPFSVEVRGKGERIGLIPAFIEEVDSVVGPFNLTLSAIGDRDSLFADGRFRFRDGVLGMRDLADPIESLYVRLSLDGDRLSVDSLTGVIGALPIDSKSIWARLKRLFTRKRKEYGRFAIGGSLDLSDPKS